MCLELSGGRGTLEALTQYLREEVAMSWIGVGPWRVSTGCIRDILYTLLASTGILIATPAPGARLPYIGPSPFSLSLYPTLSLQRNNAVWGLTTLAGCRGRSSKPCPGPSIL